MNLLVWLLFLVGTWPVVRWALQARSALMVGCHDRCVVSCRQVCAQQMSDPRPRCPVCRRRSELEHLEGWMVGRASWRSSLVMFFMSAEGVTSHEGRCLSFVTKTDLDLKTCTSIVTKRKTVLLIEMERVKQPREPMTLGNAVFEQTWESKGGLTWRPYIENKDQKLHRSRDFLNSTGQDSWPMAWVSRNVPRFAVSLQLIVSFAKVYFANLFAMISYTC